MNNLAAIVILNEIEVAVLVALGLVVGVIGCMAVNAIRNRGRKQILALFLEDVGELDEEDGPENGDIKLVVNASIWDKFLLEFWSVDDDEEDDPTDEKGETFLDVFRPEDP